MTTYNRTLRTHIGDPMLVSLREHVANDSNAAAVDGLTPAPHFAVEKVKRTIIIRYVSHARSLIVYKRKNDGLEYNVANHLRTTYGLAVTWPGTNSKGEAVTVTQSAPDPKPASKPAPKQSTLNTPVTQADLDKSAASMAKLFRF